VDEAIRLYNEAQDSGDHETVMAMRKAFADRIDDLEDFYLKHDDDERAILFEKQRLRLRKLLHSAPDSIGPTATSPSVASPEQEPDLEEDSFQQEAAPPSAPRTAPTNAPSSWTKPALHGRFSTMGGIHHPASVPGAGTTKASHKASPRNKAASPAASMTKSQKRTQKKVTALYDWEKDGANEDLSAIQDQQSAYAEEDGHHLIAAASGERGHYVADDGEGGGDTFFDLQIVLSDDEYKMIQSRMRQKRAEDKHQARNKKKLETAQGDSTE
jgi:hypothetical protein